MKNGVKLLVGFLIALVSIGVVCALALRYLDVLLKPVVAVRRAIDKRNGVAAAEEEDFSCDCDELFEN